MTIWLCAICPVRVQLCDRHQLTVNFQRGKACKVIVCDAHLIQVFHDFKRCLNVFKARRVSSFTNLCLIHQVFNCCCIFFFIPKLEFLLINLLCCKKLCRRLGCGISQFIKEADGSLIINILCCFQLLVRGFYCLVCIFNRAVTGRKAVFCFLNSGFRAFCCLVCAIQCRSLFFLRLFLFRNGILSCRHFLCRRIDICLLCALVCFLFRKRKRLFRYCSVCILFFCFSCGNGFFLCLNKALCVNDGLLRRCKLCFCRMNCRKSRVSCRCISAFSRKDRVIGCESVIIFRLCLRISIICFVQSCIRVIQSRIRLFCFCSRVLLCRICRLPILFRFGLGCFRGILCCVCRIQCILCFLHLRFHLCLDSVRVCKDLFRILDCCCRCLILRRRRIQRRLCRFKVPGCKIIRALRRRSIFLRELLCAFRVILCNLRVRNCCICRFRSRCRLICRLCCRCCSCLLYGFIFCSLRCVLCCLRRVFSGSAALCNRILRLCKGSLRIRCFLLCVFRLCLCSRKICFRGICRLLCRVLFRLCACRLTLRRGLFPRDCGLCFLFCLVYGSRCFVLIRKRRSFRLPVFLCVRRRLFRENGKSCCRGCCHSTC